MPEVVKSPAMLLMAIVVFLLLVVIVFELFYRIKIGRAICNYTGGLLLQITGYAGLFVGLTKTGIEAACNLLFF